MLIVTYAEQLKMIAAEEQVDLLDAVKQAGLHPSTYSRAIKAGSTPLKQKTAEQIAEAIRAMGVR